MIATLLWKDQASREKAVYGNAFRRRRFAAFLALVDDVLKEQDRVRVLDLGGGVSYWKGLEEAWRDRPIEITLVNLAEEPVPDARFVSLAGNACSLPEMADGSFDIVHSNSVIEHVGGWEQKRRMANEVRRLAPRYFVQTPNYWFPVEPHFRTPAIHWMPRMWRRGLVMRRALGFYPKAQTLDEAHRILDDASLVDAREMAELFPEARIERERVFGLTKSLIAIH
ncbi:class I SAM-dependent methyltransferase [Enterovirga rhinocerotis]|uniref:Methyltransferase family protein n=1 Tax=Enterovirga rhinocerotis TaxID=1339210 RepID=A0A4R7BR60_9HYPH|nr:class I SAM-dependent methyltransferase [Enterovirga rhinocerotis]TDR88164.1 methyltransferase family protein [Enterovirga rhinocerotis]